jgi:hypothetical protein
VLSVALGLYQAHSQKRGAVFAYFLTAHFNMIAGLEEKAVGESKESKDRDDGPVRLSLSSP